MNLQSTKRFVSMLLLPAAIGFAVLVDGCAHPRRVADQAAGASPLAESAADSIAAFGESLTYPVRLLVLEPRPGDNPCLVNGEARVIGALSDAEVKQLAAIVRGFSQLPVILAQGTSRGAVIRTGTGCGGSHAYGDIFYFRKRGAEWKEVRNGPQRTGWSESTVGP